MRRCSARCGRRTAHSTSGRQHIMPLAWKSWQLRLTRPWTGRGVGLGRTARCSGKNSVGNCRRSARRTPSLSCLARGCIRGMQPICEQRKYVPRRIMRDRSWRVSCGTTTTGGRSPRDSGRIIISPSAQRRAASRAAGKECRSALSLTGKAAPRELCRWRTRSGAFRSGLGTH